MTVEQFRSHDSLPVEWAKELQNNYLLRTVLFDVMEESHPSRFALNGDANEDVSPTRAAIELGLTRGYSKYADTLKLLAQRKIKAADIGEPTYDPPPVQ